MKAFIYEKYGTYENLKLDKIEKPLPQKDNVLVKIHSVSLNSSDIEFLTAKPGYVRMWGPFKPKFKVLGSDISGVVEKIGPKCTKFKIGDEVFGDILGIWGGFSEYVAVPEKMIRKKPEFISFEDAASLPQAASVALQGLVDKGKIEKDEHILIIGAGGGAGSFAIQLAKYFGCNVTGVDKQIKFEFMRSLGADYVIDYQSEDLMDKGQTYDMILDFIGSYSVFSFKELLNLRGRYVIVGGSVSRLLQVLIFGSILSAAGKRKIGILGAKPNKDMDLIIDLVKSSKLKTAIDKRYEFEKLPEAVKYLAEGRAKGKIVININ